MIRELDRAISSGIKLLESLDMVDELPGRLQIFSDHHWRIHVAQKANHHYFRGCESQAWN